MSLSPDPTSTQPASPEVQLLAECYAVLLADIRRNRAKRLAQSASKAVTFEEAQEMASAPAIEEMPLEATA